MILSLVNVFNILRFIFALRVEYKDDSVSICYRNVKIRFYRSEVYLMMYGSNFRLSTPDGYVMINCDYNFSPKKEEVTTEVNIGG